MCTLDTCGANTWHKHGDQDGLAEWALWLWAGNNSFSVTFPMLITQAFVGVQKYIYVFVGPPYNLARYLLHVGASDSACSSNSDCHSSSFCGPIKSDVDDPSLSLLPNSHLILCLLFTSILFPPKRKHIKKNYNKKKPIKKKKTLLHYLMCILLIHLFSSSIPSKCTQISRTSPISS